MLIFKIYLALLVHVTLDSVQLATADSSIQEFYRVSAEKVTKSSPIHKKDNSKKGRLVNIIQTLLDTEIKKLENSITDSVMEEVINYYGTKLQSAENLRTDVTQLNQRLDTLNKTLDKMEMSQKFVSKSHQNLVNTVRNSMANAKRMRDNFMKFKVASAIQRKSLRNRKESISTNTRALSEKYTIQSTTSTTTTKASILKAETLKLQLIKDLETKYSSLVGSNSLTNAIFKNLKNTTLAATVTEDEDLESENDLKNEAIEPNDCQDLSNNGFTKNGVYKVYQLKSNQSFDVYCEFENNIGWTVLQRRHDGSVTFNQDWNTYKNGFGNLFDDHEFWLGLERMHILTNQFNYSLQIIMSDWKNQEYIAEYGQFKINDEKNKYRLTITGYFTNSTAGDSLGDSINAFQSHNQMGFSTYDSDNDMRFYDNCAKIFKSGWWFNACFQTNLNGAYYHYSGKVASTGKAKSRRLREEENSQLRFLRNGIHWNSIDFYKSLKATKLRIRRNQ